MNFNRRGSRGRNLSILQRRGRPGEKGEEGDYTGTQASPERGKADNREEDRADETLAS